MHSPLRKEAPSQAKDVTRDLRKSEAESLILWRSRWEQETTRQYRDSLAAGRPANGEPRMGAIFNEFLIFPQENGPDVELVVNGDEFYARYEDLEASPSSMTPTLGSLLRGRPGRSVHLNRHAADEAASRRPGAPPQGIAGGTQQQVQPALRAPAAQGGAGRRARRADAGTGTRSPWGRRLSSGRSAA